MTHQDKTDRARALAEEARDVSIEIEELSAKLDEKERRLNSILTGELVDLMNETEIDTIGLPAKGNLPGVDLELQQFVAASIPKTWDAPRRQAAFDALPDSLIKASVVTIFPRDYVKKAEKLCRELKGRGFTSAVEMSVHPQTLAAWLREQLAQGGHIPPLDVIGAIMGNRVKIKERKDD